MFKWLSKHNKKIMLVIVAMIVLALVLPLLFPLLVHGSSLQNQVQQQQTIQQQLNRQISEAREREEGLVATKTRIDQQLTEIESEISDINAEIAELDAQIEEKQVELEAAQEVVDRQQAVFHRRIRAIYEEGGGSNLQVFLEAQSLSDMFYIQEMLEIIMEHERQLLEEMEQARRTIEVNKIVIEETKQRVDEARRTLVARRSEANEMARQQQSLIDEAVNDRAGFERQLREAQAAEESLRRQMQSQLSSSGGVAVTGGQLQRPASGPITSPFGNRIHPVTGTNRFHSGIDIGAANGSAIVAGETGVVTFSGWNGGYGNCIIIDHGGGRATLYAHASQLIATRGQSVSRGQQIARVGSTGVSTGPHLHFEVLHNGTPVNPAQYI